MVLAGCAKKRLRLRVLNLINFLQREVHTEETSYLFFLKQT